ncbi:MAG: acyltransferase [Bacteroidetes bacterium]|nr:acyltransferase [Bacteroidota bacterium]
MAYLTEEQLSQVGFKELGENVNISDKASIYKPNLISIGSNIRIDDFCILSASNNIKIGNYVHIAPYSSFIGKGEILIEDFVSISGRVSLYSSTDDYMGWGMTNPLIPDKFRRETSGQIHLKKHVIIGAGSIIMPNVVMEIGSAVSALTLIVKNCEPFTIYRGIPGVEIGKRKQKFLELEKEFYAQYN